MDASSRMAWLGKRIREKRLVPRPAPSREEPAPAPAVIRYGRHRPRRAVPVPGAARPPVRIEEAVDGRVVEVPGVGPTFVVENREEVAVRVDPGLLFFDIEAAGLTAAPLFLIGVMRATRTSTGGKNGGGKNGGGTTMTVTQFLASADEQQHTPIVD